MSVSVLTPKDATSFAVRVSLSGPAENTSAFLEHLNSAQLTYRKLDTVHIAISPKGQSNPADTVVCQEGSYLVLCGPFWDVYSSMEEVLEDFDTERS